jgi:hypothetical protein
MSLSINVYLLGQITLHMGIIMILPTRHLLATSTSVGAGCTSTSTSANTSTSASTKN